MIKALTLSAAWDAGSCFFCSASQNRLRFQRARPHGKLRETGLVVLLLSLGFSAFFIYKDLLGIQVKGWQCPASPRLMSNQRHGEKSISGEVSAFQGTTNERREFL